MNNELQWIENKINEQSFASAKGFGFRYYIQNNVIASIWIDGNVYDYQIPSKQFSSFILSKQYCQSHHDVICKAVEETKEKTAEHARSIIG